MDKKNPLSELLQESMDKVREMVDTNTIVGQPISTPDGVTLIPISKVSFGFGGGGGVFGNKKEPAAEGTVSAGVGAGVRVDPVAFLIVKDGTVRVMPVAVPAVGTVERVVEMIPNVIDQVGGYFKKKTESEDTTC